MPDDDSKPKRNKPCKFWKRKPTIEQRITESRLSEGESCRTHRRKCIMHHPNVCVRCQRMGLPCFFKFCTKPLSSIQQKKSISASKKSRLLKKFWLLEQDAELLESELKELSTLRQPEEVEEEEEERRSWQVCIQRSQQNLIMDSNITSIGAFLSLIQQVSGHFRLQHTPPTSLSVHADQHPLPITLRVTPFEKALREMFTAVQPLVNKQSAASSCSSSSTSLTEVKQHLIDIYFACPHLHNPVLVKPYYHGYMHHHLDDMISWAAAAFVSYSSCHHVKDYFSHTNNGWTQHQVGAVCESEAKRLLDQAVFVDWTCDHDLSVSWLFTAHMLTHCALSTLRNKQARTYADGAWRMALQLKEIYVPVLKSQCGDETMIHAESWRRLYVVTRYMDVSLNLVNDQGIDVSQLAAHFIDIGFPEPLPCERSDEVLLDAVAAFRDLTKLHHVAFTGYGERLSLLAFRLYTGKLTSIGVEDLRAIEARFVDFWYGLPLQHRIGTSPLDYIQMDRVHQCPSARALRVNAVYYVVIMSTMLRIMQHRDIDVDGNDDNDDSNDDTDSTSPLMDRMDGDRALLVVSICCDAVIKIYHVLHLRLPCTIELHWLSIVLDTILLLVHAKNQEIRQRAKQGARSARDLFRQYLGRRYHADDEGCGRTPSSTPTWTSSSSHSTDSSNQDPPSARMPTQKLASSRLPSLTYHDLLAQQMDAHLTANDAHFYL